jgi:protein-S-isoprenylcysteine O-methyltransferase Ste14
MMYAAIILLVFSITIVLGPLWALVPACLIAAVFGLRTLLEDRLLRMELPGCQEYAVVVRYRRLPWVW